MKRSLKFTCYYTFIVIGLFALGVFLSQNINNTYAISVGVDRSDFPTSTFTTNISSVSNMNYMNTALSASSLSSSWRSFPYIAFLLNFGIKII